MKKLLAVLLAVLMVCALTGCNKTEKTDLEKAKEEGKITIANVVNGTLGDKSFFDSGDEGLKKMMEKYPDKVYGKTIELTYDSATWGTGLEEVFRQGWDIIICGTYDMKEYVIPLLSEYPDQKVWFYDEEWNFDDKDGWQYAPTDKLYAMMFAQNEGSFVVGYMAAALSKTHQIAFMGGMDNTVLEDFYVGYADGAAYYDSTHGTHTAVLISWMNSFSDATAGKDKANGLFAAGVDIVFCCGGQAGLGGFDQVITEGEDKWVIGVDGNQGAYFASLNTPEGTAKAERTITSMQKNVNEGFFAAFEKELKGEVPYGQNVRLGLNGGFVSYSITDTTKKLFTTEQLAEFEGVVQKIISGEVKTGTAFGHETGWFETFVEAHNK